MEHWPWGTIWIALGAIATFVSVLLLGGKWLGDRMDTANAKADAKAEEIKAQNERQLESQRNFDRIWYGEDAQFPGGPRIPGMVERVTNIEQNTQGVPEQLVEIKGRLGKLESEQAQDRQLLVDHITDSKKHEGNGL